MKEKYLGFSKKRFCGEGVKGVGVGQKGRRKRTIFTHKEKENKYFIFILFFIFYFNPGQLQKHYIM